MYLETQKVKTYLQTQYIFSFFLVKTKDWPLEKETKVYTQLTVGTVQIFFYSFTWILADYMAHEMTKIFWNKLEDFQALQA